MTKELNLYRSYRRATQTKSNFNFLRSYFTLPIILAIVALVVWAFMLRANTDLLNEIEEVDSWLNDPDVIAEYDQALLKDEYNNKLSMSLTEVDELTAALSTYPEINSQLLQSIAGVGGEQVSMVITGYDSNLGELFFEAHSPEVIDIPGYVLKLQETALFHNVDYTGYRFDDEEYILHLRCTLKADAGRKGAGA